MPNVNVMRTPNDKVSKQRSVACRFSGTNPFDSDSELDLDRKPPRSFSAPPISKGNCSKTSQYRHKENEEKGTSTSLFSGFSAERNNFRNDFNGSGGIENQSVQELENYAAYKSEETTKEVNGCLRIAEEIRESASRTLVVLHQQGQQITRTHQTAVDIEYDLSRGEKLLASLGGIFSRTWKPTKASPIKGPLLTRDDSFERKGSNQMEQRQRLGISGPSLGSSPPNTLHEPTSALKKTEIEQTKQDNALSDLSNLLGELKEMAVDMGAELDRQTTALGHTEDDIDILNSRVKTANIRGRRLLGK